MLRYAMIISTCLLLLGISCSRMKQAQQCSGGTDPNTGQCLTSVDPNAAHIANMQAQIDAQTKMIQDMLRNDQQKQLELMQLRNALDNEKDPKTRTEAVVEKLEEWGLIDLGVQYGGKWLNDLLNDTSEAQPHDQQGTQ